MVSDWRCHSVGHDSPWTRPIQYMDISSLLILSWLDHHTSITTFLLSSINCHVWGKAIMLNSGSIRVHSALQSLHNTGDRSRDASSDALQDRSCLLGQFSSKVLVCFLRAHIKKSIIIRRQRVKEQTLFLVTTFKRRQENNQKIHYHRNQ